RKRWFPSEKTMVSLRENSGFPQRKQCKPLLETIVLQNLVFAATCHPSATILHALYLKAFLSVGGRVADKTRKFRCVTQKGIFICRNPQYYI
ncbi:MAG: hypothetical protein K6E15_13535, partial [Prevotella sp.]|nr:hypothetical protein [Prevotella sp.]